MVKGLSLFPLPPPMNPLTLKGPLFATYFAGKAAHIHSDLDSEFKQSSQNSTGLPTCAVLCTPFNLCSPMMWPRSMEPQDVPPD